MDVLMFNQELSFAAERHLQSVGASDSLDGQNTFTLKTVYTSNSCSKAIMGSTAWISQKFR